MSEKEAIKVKIATLPKSGTYLFKNIVDFLKEGRGISIEVDHVVMPNRPDFIDDVTPTIVTSRDPRGYFYSLLNFYNKRSDAVISGTMSRDFAYRYFDPQKVGKWIEMTNDERLFALIDDTPDSLMVVKSRDSYDAVMQSKSKSNCYVTTFERFAPVKDPSHLGEQAILEYIRMFNHLGIEMDVAYVKKILGACWGNSITYTPNDVDDWKRRLSRAVQDRIVDRYHDVFDMLDYRIESPSSRSWWRWR
jgi:hypothetical protein